MNDQMFAQEKASFTQMVYDLAMISAIDEKSVAALSAVLASFSGLVDRETVEVKLEECFEGTEEGGSTDVVACILRAVSSLTPEQIEGAVSSFQQWINSNEKRRASAPREMISNLQRNLSILIQEYPAIDLMFRAEAASRGFGDEFVDVDFVVDFRPVFSVDESTIDALVLLTRLNLSYIGKNSARQSCALVLTGDELAYLHHKTSEAMRRLDLLKQLDQRAFLASTSEST